MGDNDRDDGDPDDTCADNEDEDVEVKMRRVKIRHCKLQNGLNARRNSDMSSHSKTYFSRRYVTKCKYAKNNFRK